MPPEWFAAMLDFYREADAEIASLDPACRACGDCCRFDRAEHILYASRLEKDYLLNASPPPPAPDAPPELLAAGLRCPYQIGGRCLARDGRVLGCRLHFCSWSDAGAAEDMAERWHQRLKRLHERLGVEWIYAPLLPL